MTEWLKFDDATKRRSIEQSASKTGLRAQVIEKDWWVTLTLKALFSSEYRSYLHFKGGTSLSKGWKLINRFSEDIDIALSPEAIGQEFIGDPARNDRQRLRKAGCKFTAEVLKPAIESQFREFGVPDDHVKFEVVVESSDADPAIILVYYRSVIDRLEYVSGPVKIEVSVRSSGEPSKRVPIQSILTESIPGLTSESAFEVTAVEPRKTFIEKIFLLHEEFQKPNPNSIKSERMSRHLYDIVQLFDAGVAIEALADTDLYSSIINHRKWYYKLSGVDYATHAYESICFIPPESVIELYSEDYDTMRQSMIYGEVPPFFMLLQKLGELLRKTRERASTAQIGEAETAIISGSYIRWWEDDRDKGKGRVFAKASVKHESDIKYSIECSTLISYAQNDRFGIAYKENEVERWTGELIMETPTSGMVIWKQTHPREGAAGFKRVRVDGGMLHLVGEKKRGYGDEVFTEKEI